MNRKGVKRDHKQSKAIKKAIESNQQAMKSNEKQKAKKSQSKSKQKAMTSNDKQ